MLISFSESLLQHEIGTSVSLKNFIRISKKFKEH